MCSSSWVVRSGEQWRKGNTYNRSGFSEVLVESAETGICSETEVSVIFVSAIVAGTVYFSNAGGGCRGRKSR